MKPRCYHCESLEYLVNVRLQKVPATTEIVVNNFTSKQLFLARNLDNPAILRYLTKHFGESTGLVRSAVVNLYRPQQFDVLRKVVETKEQHLMKYYSNGLYDI